MASARSVRYLKGQRTTFRTQFGTNVPKAQAMLDKDTNIMNDTEKRRHMTNIGAIADKLTEYVTKFQQITEELSQAIEQSDNEDLKQTLEQEEQRDFEILDNVQDCIKQLNRWLMDEQKTSRSSNPISNKENELLEKLINNQKEMEERALQAQEEMELRSQRERREMDERNQQNHAQLETRFRGLMQRTQSSTDNQSSSTRLPKLEMAKFDGDILKFPEFWGQFEAVVDKNTKLSPIEKFNYLRSYLTGDALSVIQGLLPSNENYREAVTVIKDRFGQTSMIVNALYSRLTQLPVTTNNSLKLRQFFDEAERLFRTLQALGKNLNHEMFIPLIQSKLPKQVIIKLSEQLGELNEWTMENLWEALRKHVRALEMGERHAATLPQSQNEQNSRASSAQQNSNKPRYGNEMKQNSSASALVAGGNQWQKQNQSPQRPCIFCSGVHWSDECQTYPTVDQRKLQVKGHCFNCLGTKHKINECKRRKPCFHCKLQGKHHSSLCPKMFSKKSEKLAAGQQKIQAAAVAINEDGLNEEDQHEIAAVATNGHGHYTMMQTVTTKVRNPVNHKLQEKVRILIDNGSSNVWASDSLAQKLKLQKGPTQKFDLSTFGSQGSSADCHKTKLEFQLLDGSYHSVLASIWPSKHLTKPMKRYPVNPDIIKEIKHYPLADKIPTEVDKMDVDLIIGNDYISDLMLPGKIPIQSADGLYLLQSQFGWILSGRLNKDYQEDSSTISCLSFLAISYGKQLNSQPVLFNSPEWDRFPSDSKVEFKSVPECTDNQNVLTTVTQATKENVFDTSLWDQYVALETIGIKDSITETDDDKAMEHFNQTVKKIDGRYHIRYPWKPNRVPPENYALAVGRLRSLIRRIKQEKVVPLMDSYNKILNDQLEQGIIEKVGPNTEQTRLKHYIPHHPVITPSKATTKVRLVYDASAKPNPKDEYQSLNDCLYCGPIQQLLQDLCALLISFRFYEIALVSDIKQAFLQIGLQMADRDATRFLWFKDTNKPEIENNLQIYRFCRIPFGVKPSPFLLAAVLEHHLKPKNNSILQKLRHSLYVDNVVTGTTNLNDAFEFYKVSKNELNEGISMNLREWRSNSSQFMDSIPEEDRAKNTKDKVLGITWDSINDTLSISSSIKPTNAIVTKRRVAQVVAAVFDPMGIFSPIRFNGTNLLQELWKINLEWDKPIPPDKLVEWERIEENLTQIPNFQFPRFIGPKLPNLPTQYSLLCFCDASQQAYATVVYLQWKTTNGECKTNLIFAKTRPTPKKMKKNEVATIPRLELMAILIGARAVRWLKHKLEEILQIKFHQLILWSDSTIALSWLNTEKSLSVVVENRVKEINSQSDIKFCHVSTDQNPADIATRTFDQTVSEFMLNSFWWSGPEWISSPQEMWPNFQYSPLNVLNEMAFLRETKTKQNQAASCLAVGEGPNGKLNKIDMNSIMKIEDYSNLTNLLRITAWICRVINNWKQWSVKKSKNEIKKTPLSAEEIQQARLYWELTVQKQYFAEEIQAIQQNKTNQLCKQLGLTMDQNEIIRCLGQFQYSEMSEGSKMPKLLPSKGHFTKLVIEQCHANMLHCGVSQTLATTRQAYWITQGRSTVKKVLHQCGICRRIDGGPYQAPEFPPFPKEVSQLSPFSLTGLDYLGPIYVKTMDGTKKTWVCIFTCRTIRAIHLEIVEDMTTQQFLMAIRRFFARWGIPKKIISDNALQFKTAHHVLDKLYSNTQVHEFLSNKGLKWTFITELAPWMGGFYERLVQSVKKPLKKTLGKKHIGLTELSTILAEVQSVLNDRPLTYVGDDINSSIVLTPNKLLFAYRKTSLPSTVQENLNDDDASADYQPPETLNLIEKLTDMWKTNERQCNQFWKLFLQEYLPSLRERYQTQMKQKRIKSHEEPKVGSIVLIHDSLPRAQWKMGRIIKLIPSKDGSIRTAQVRLPSNNVINRSITQLYPFEIPHSMEQDIHDSQTVDNDTLNSSNGNPISLKNIDDQNEQSSRPKRQAAIRAKQKTGHWIQQLTDSTNEALAALINMDN